MVLAAERLREIRYSYPIDGESSAVARRLEASNVFEKDILRTGRFYVPNTENAPKDWDVSKETLLTIRDGFYRSKRSGGDCPVTWDHSDSELNRVGKVVDLDVREDLARPERPLTLFAKIEIDKDDDAKEIEWREGVSVHVDENFVDGDRISYPLFLRHVAVVQHPVVKGQSRFKRLSLTSSTSSKHKGAEKMFKWLLTATGSKIVSRKLADGETPPEGAAVVDSPTDPAPVVTAAPEYPAIDDDAAKYVVEIINSLLPGGVTLPEGTNGENVIAHAKTVVSTLTQAGQLGGDKSQAPNPVVDAGMEAIDAMPLDSMAMSSLRTAVEKYREDRKRQLSAIADAKKVALTQAEIDFKSKLDSLLRTGKISVALADGLREAGKNASFALSMLAPFEKEKEGSSVPVVSKTRKLASPSTKGGEGVVVGGDMSPKRAREISRSAYGV